MTVTITTINYNEVNCPPPPEAEEKLRGGEVRI